MPKLVTVMVKALVLERPTASVTRTVKVDVPPVVGVPLRTPAVERARPAGQGPGGEAPAEGSGTAEGRQRGGRVGGAAGAPGERVGGDGGRCGDADAELVAQRSEEEADDLDAVLRRPGGQLGAGRDPAQQAGEEVDGGDCALGLVLVLGGLGEAGHDPTAVPAAAVELGGPERGARRLARPAEDVLVDQVDELAVGEGPVALAELGRLGEELTDRVEAPSSGPEVVGPVVEPGEVGAAQEVRLVEADVRWLGLPVGEVSASLTASRGARRPSPSRATQSARSALVGARPAKSLNCWFVKVVIDVNGGDAGAEAGDGGPMPSALRRATRNRYASPAIRPGISASTTPTGTSTVPPGLTGHVLDQHPVARHAGLRAALGHRHDQPVPARPHHRGGRGGAGGLGPLLTSRRCRRHRHQRSDGAHDQDRPRRPPDAAHRPPLPTTRCRPTHDGLPPGTVRLRTYGGSPGGEPSMCANFAPSRRWSPGATDTVPVEAQYRRRVLVGREAELQSVRDHLAVGAVVRGRGAGGHRQVDPRSRRPRPGPLPGGRRAGHPGLVSAVRVRAVAAAQPARPARGGGGSGAPVGDGSSVLLDDVQWCDDASLEVLGLLVGRLPMVFTVRTGEARSDEVLGALGLIGVPTLELGGLPSRRGREPGGSPASRARRRPAPQPPRRGRREPAPPQGAAPHRRRPDHARQRAAGADGRTRTGGPRGHGPPGRPRPPGGTRPAGSGGGRAGRLRHGRGRARGHRRAPRGSWPRSSWRTWGPAPTRCDASLLRWWTTRRRPTCCSPQATARRPAPVPCGRPSGSRVAPGPRCWCWPSGAHRTWT